MSDLSVHLCNNNYDGFILTDIDDCEAGTHNCPYQCVNTHGSWECECDPGYEGDGFTCVGK